MDTAFWQKSFASEVNSTVPGYDLAATAILAVPWCAGTIIGLSARAIEKTPVWILYPGTLTLKQVNSGLVMPYVLKSLLGTGATTGLLVLIFMAVTSTVSSSMIAVSSIISLDFYRTYVNPRASDRRILQVSHLGVVFHGTFMAAFALMLNYAGATSNWSTYFRPVVACPGIFPMMFTILWSRQTKLAAILSPILGLIFGLTTWLTLSWYWSGAINIQTTQEQLPGLYGAIVSFFSPALFSVIISLLKPERFDWREFLKIHLIEDGSPAASGLPSLSPSKDAVVETSKNGDTDSEKGSPRLESRTAGVPNSRPRGRALGNLDDVVHPFSDATIAHINKWLRFASIYFVINVLVTIVLWPLPLYRDWIFTKSFFKGWVSMAIVWLFFAIGAVVVYPLYDGRHAIFKVIRGVLKGRR